MEIVAIATKIGERILPFFFKSKTVKQIGKEIREATDTELSLLWEKIKPWLIEEYEEDKPLDDTFENEDVKGVVKKGLKNADADTQNAHCSPFEKMEERQTTTGNTAKWRAIRILSIRALRIAPFKFIRERAITSKATKNIQY
ncbi:MAG: hypothetical protein HC892_21060 [Saprospiraceae bacterium]|nr:hypothetical protein [Saprospiraceae bacterium]